MFCVDRSIPGLLILCDDELLLHGPIKDTSIKLKLDQDLNSREISFHRYRVDPLVTGNMVHSLINRGIDMFIKLTQTLGHFRLDLLACVVDGHTFRRSITNNTIISK